MSDRYEGLTGGTSGRNFYRALIKRFGIDAKRFRSYTWADQRMYAELLVEDIQQEREEAGDPSAVTFNAAGDLADSPFRVTRV